ncbi:maleylacetate reductase [Metabacillus sediminilitoris]|uniref:maleylacetate reductase n=1 Tax=Metabacillus sediminilitoris TaxID=2567941 RepID=UPI001454B9B3|nr:maleylacetate reductase [Metabacillus sediminilitoris]
MEIVEKSVEMVKEQQIDSLVPFGGGSSIGLAKVIPLNKHFSTNYRFSCHIRRFGNDANLGNNRKWNEENR